MKTKVLLIVALLLAAIAAVGIYGRSYLNPPARPGTGLSSPPSPAPAAPNPSLPPLEDSDAFVREKAGPLSGSPLLAAWLKLESLIPRLTSALNQLADGQVARDAFAPFRPRGKFRVRRKEGRTLVDPASWARYDAFAAMVQSIDAVATARLYERLYPLFDAAQSGLGEAARPRELFLAAARPLLDAPIPEGEPDLMEGKKGLGWVYVDERLERLSPAQKQLLRMGPKNQAIVQAKLNAVILALGR